MSLETPSKKCQIFDDMFVPLTIDRLLQHGTVQKYFPEHVRKIHNDWRHMTERLLSEPEVFALVNWEISTEWCDDFYSAPWGQKLEGILEVKDFKGDVVKCNPGELHYHTMSTGLVLHSGQEARLGRYTIVRPRYYRVWDGESGSIRKTEAEMQEMFGESFSAIRDDLDDVDLYEEWNQDLYYSETVHKSFTIVGLWETRLLGYKLFMFDHDKNINDSKRTNKHGL